MNNGYGSGQRNAAARAAPPWKEKGFTRRVGRGQLQGHLLPMGAALLCPAGMGPGCAWLVRLQLIPQQVLPRQGELPACLPRGGQEVAVAEDPGAPSLALLPAPAAGSATAD